jgi:hypothetical protein
VSISISEARALQTPNNRRVVGGSSAFAVAAAARVAPGQLRRSRCSKALTLAGLHARNNRHEIRSSGGIGVLKLG